MCSSDLFVNKYQITQKDYETYLTYGDLNDKVTETLGITYIPNTIELDQTKELLLQTEYVPSATITQILLTTRNELGELIPEDKLEEVHQEALEVLERAKQGESMSELALMYSDDPAVDLNEGVYNFSKGMLDEKLETVVFNEAVIGEVYPELVETYLGYEVVRVDALSYPNEIEVNEVAIKRIQDAFVTSELTELSELYKINKEESYNEIHIMTVDETLESSN